RDHDFRRPGFTLSGEAERAPPPEDRHEQYEYRPGAFLIEGGSGGGTPVADDKSVARRDPAFGRKRAERLLGGDRLGKRAVSFDGNVIDLHPGRVITLGHH